jgi:hypothetical protein
MLPPSMMPPKSMTEKAAMALASASAMASNALKRAPPDEKPKSVEMGSERFATAKASQVIELARTPMPHRTSLALSVRDKGAPRMASSSRKRQCMPRPEPK